MATAPSWGCFGLPFLVIINVLLVGRAAEATERTHFDSPEAVFSSLYRTYEGMIEEVRDLKNAGCPLEVSSIEENRPFYAKITKFAPNGTTNEYATKKTKFLLVFNEHANEVIASEVGMELLNRLCKGDSDILSKSEILIVPVVDVSGRKILETDHRFCQRQNYHHVDLNRNWDARWNPGSKSSTTFGGPNLSLKKTAASFKPNAFIDVHSGTLGWYSPYSYSTNRPIDEGTRNTNVIFSELNPLYCNCETGGAGEVSGYLAYGTSQDYLFDTLHVPYSIVIEVFDGFDGSNKYKNPPRARHMHHREKRKSNQRFLSNHKTNTTSQLHREKIRRERIETLMSRAREGLITREEKMECFQMYNPTDIKMLDGTTNNWSSAILEVMKRIIAIH
ncbi:hypothetical protein AAMO2058_001209400 [Amorphochlora amoebiformis]